MKFEELNLPTIWTEIKGYPNYQISICWKVKNIKNNRILKACENTKGYCYVELNGKCLKIHRLVALHFLPNVNNDKYVDHRNNNRKDNTISNLRYCSNKENCYNASLSKKNTSGTKGVYFSKSMNRWCAQINFNGKRIYLGCYKRIEDAIDVRRKTSNELFGEFVNDCEK